jgi:hypothetical protein
MRRVWLAAALALGCGGGSAGDPMVKVPARATTAGGALLGAVPAGADALLELDLARLRANPAIGPLARALSPGAAAAADPTAGGGLVGGDVLVLASYGLGDGAPRTLIVARGAAIAAVPGAVALDAVDAIAVGDAELVRRAQAAAAGAEPAIARDATMMTLRAAAMPPGAAAAAVRLTARLDFDARVALADRLELDAAPATISLWGDVVDDLAVIALLDGDRPRDAKGLEQLAGQLVRRLAAGSPVYGRLLARELGRTAVAKRAAGVRLTLVIGPKRLGRLVSRAMAVLTAPVPSPSPSPEPTP